MSNEVTMTRYGSLSAIGLGLLLAACSGRVSVGVEPADDAKAGSAGSAGDGRPNAGGSMSTSAGGSGTGNGGAGACAFGPTQMAPDERPLLSSAEVLSRIFQFLDNDPRIPAGALPEEPTPAWAAARAKGILDVHYAEGTPAPGLVRFLTRSVSSRLVLPDDSLESPARWGLALVAPDATLSTLLLAPTEEPPRQGFLGEREFLSLHPTISSRGTWISTYLLCQPVPVPPEGTGHGAPLPVVDGLTRREQLEASISQPQCTGCHGLIDPVGSSLEHFNELGEYRELDNGKPVNAAGTAYYPELSFEDYPDLAAQLATSCEAARCFADLLVQDAFRADTRDDGLGAPLSEAEINRVAESFAASGHSIRALVDSIVRSPSFLR
jgi:hypothetical protein